MKKDLSLSLIHTHTFSLSSLLGFLLRGGRRRFHAFRLGIVSSISISSFFFLLFSLRLLTSALHTSSLLQHGFICRVLHLGLLPIHIHRIAMYLLRVKPSTHDSSPRLLSANTPPGWSNSPTIL